MLLPHPEGPTTDANSPGGEPERHAVERRDPTALERLGEALDDDVDAAVRGLAHITFTWRFRTLVYVLPPSFDFTVQRNVSPPSGFASVASGGNVM